MKPELAKLRLDKLRKETARKRRGRDYFHVKEELEKDNDKVARELIEKLRKK